MEPLEVIAGACNPLDLSLPGHPISLRAFAHSAHAGMPMKKLGGCGDALKLDFAEEISRQAPRLQEANLTADYVLLG